MPRLARIAAIFPLALVLFPLPAAADDPPLDAVTATSAIAALHVPEVTEAHLDNGLTVVFEENHQAPFVSLVLRYAAGSGDDGPGKSGLAALTLSLATKGTKHVPAGEYEKTLTRIGAAERGWGVAFDTSSEWTTVPSNALDTVLWLWSDQMGFFAPGDPHALAKALGVQARLREDKVTSVALGSVHELVQGALFPEGHPYHSAAFALPSASLSLDDVRAFHDRHFAPNEAVLVLVGDFSTAAALEKVRTYFGPITAAPPRGPAKIVPAQLGEETQLVVAANVSAPEVWMDWRTPPFYAGGDAELDIAARAMVGRRVSILRWTLVDKLQVATAVTARQMSHDLGSDFRITATVAEGHSPDEVKLALDAVLDGLRKRGIDDAAFAGARGNVTVPHVHALDRPGERAGLYAELVMHHRDPKRLAGNVGRYDAVTVADVNTTMARWLSPGHRVITLVTPDPSAPTSGVLREIRGTK